MDKSGISAIGAKSGLEALLADLDGAAGVDNAKEVQTPEVDVISQDETEDIARLAEADALDAGLSKIFDHKAVRAAEAAAKKLADKAEKEALAAKKKADREIAAAAKKLEREMAAAQKVADREQKKLTDAAAKEAAAAVVTVAEPTPEPEVVKAPEPKVYWGKNKLGRLEHRLGENVNNVMLFGVNDGDLDPEEREALIAGNKAFFKTLPVKVQDKSTSVLEFISGKSYRLGPVVDMTVRLLSKDGFLTTGDKGNLYLRLRDMYSIGSARAMGGSTLAALKALEIVKMTGVGRYTPNPNSALLALLSAKLLLPFVNGDEALEQLEAKEAAERTPKKVAPAPVVAPEPSDDSIMADLLTGLKGFVQEAEPAFAEAPV